MISNVIKLLAAVANKISAAVSNDAVGDEISYGFDSFFSLAGPSRAILAVSWTGRGPKREAVQAWRAEERGWKEGDRRTPSSRYPSLFSSPLVRHPASSLPSFLPSLFRFLFLSLSLSRCPVSSRSLPLFLALSVTLPFEVSVLLPTAGAETVTTIIVSEVTSLKHREEEKEHEGGGGVVGVERANAKRRKGRLAYL